MRALLDRVLEFIDRRIIAVLVAIFVVSMALIVWNLEDLSKRILRASALQGTRAYIEALAEFRTVYTSEVVARLTPSGVLVTHDYEQHVGAIPLPATLSMELARRLGRGPTEVGMEARLYSEFPFPFRANGGPHDAFERDALVALRRSPDSHYYRFETRNGHPVLRYAIADRMRAPCVSCHNTHPQSPKTDWRVGDVRGVLEVIRPLDAVQAETRQGLGRTFILGGSLGLLGLLSLALVVTRLRRVAGELELTVEQRTRQLAEANQELEAFSYSVSHDLRAPLRAMDGFSQVLLEDYEDRLDDEGKRHLGRIRDASQKMGELVDDLLELSKIGRAPLVRSRVDMTAVARSALEQLRQADPERQVAITIQEGMVGVGDSHLLRVVFDNLVGNAWKFTSKKPDGEITIGTEATASGQTIYFVRDNGAGFDDTYADKLFGAFQRLHHAREFPGTGIGLATVKRIVHRHEGRVWAEGAIDQGACFRFTLWEQGAP